MHVLLRVALVAGFSAPLATQAPSAMAIPPHRVPIHTAADDHGAAYGTWAAGTDYKASFHDGMTFVPYLGHQYPKNQPWQWQTISAQWGGVDLLGTAGAVPQHDDFRFEYRFDAVTEAYDVRLDGLEQTFVISRPIGSGDLVITGGVTSGLATTPTPPTHGALTFLDASGLPILEYGAAFVIDAAGRRAPITTAYVERRITLRVESDWLAAATFPVIVDPLLSPVQVGGITSGNLRKIDIARDDLANNMMVTFVRAASNFDDDVTALVMSDSFSGIFPVYTDIGTAWDSDDASCCFVGGTAKFAITWRRYFYGSNPRASRIRAHVHPSGNTTLNTSIAVMPITQFENYWRPDIGGVEAFATGDDALVAYQVEDNTPNNGNFTSTNETRIECSLLDTSTVAGTFGTNRLVAGFPTDDNEFPNVNKVARGGAGFSWIVAWQSYDSFQNNGWRVAARRVPSFGTLPLTNWLPDFFFQSNRHSLRPVVEGMAGRYAIGFVTRSTSSAPGKTTSSVGDQVWVERFDWPHNVANPPSSGDRDPVELANAPTAHFTVRGMGYDTGDQSHWALSYVDTPSTHRALRYVRVGYNGAPTEIGSLASAGPTGLYPYGGSCVYDDDNREFKFAWGAGSTVLGHRLTYVTPGPRNTTGFGCASATIRWVGNQQIGAETNYLAITSAPSGAGHFLLVSLASANTPIVYPGVASGCRLLVDNGPAFLGTMPLRIGPNVTWDFPLPEWLDPITLHFQDWIIDGVQFESTRRLEVPIVK